jgi:hypothetical protein
MEKTDIQQKATVRSIFLMILGLFESAMLFLFSVINLKLVLLILSIIMFLAFIIGIVSLN